MPTWSSQRIHGESGVYGPKPTDWYGVDDRDGDAGEWVEAPLGSHYIYIDTTNDVAYEYVKLGEEGRDDDWSGGGMRVLQERVSYSDFTDGGGASGTYQMKGTLPLGALVVRWVLFNVVDFSGDTSAIMDIGDGSTADRFNTAANISVFGTADFIDGGAPSGTQLITTAVRPTITVTAGSDWGAVNSLAAATVRIYYYY